MTVPKKKKHTLDDVALPVEIKIDDMTIGETREFERVTGLSITVLADEATPKGDVLKALAAMGVARLGLDVAYDDLDGIRISDVQLVESDSTQKG